MHLKEKIEKENPTFYGYTIICDNNKYGIKDLSGNTIVGNIFDWIGWHRDERLVEFRLNKKHAILRVDEIPNL